jgi:hypothetical protein
MMRKWVRVPQGHVVVPREDVYGREGTWPSYGILHRVISERRLQVINDMRELAPEFNPLTDGDLHAAAELLRADKREAATRQVLADFQADQEHEAKGH